MHKKKKQRTLSSKIILVIIWVAVIAFIAIMINKDEAMKKDLMRSGKAIINSNQSESDVWLFSDKDSIPAGEIFEINVYINTQGNDLGVFVLDFNFDKSVLSVDVNKGRDGLDNGSDGKNFVLMSNPEDILDGHFRFSGICVQDCVNGNRKHIATIYAKSEADFNFYDIANRLEIKELADIFGNPLAFEKKEGAIKIK